MAEGHIHKHLHSMFHLLRNEETLKMAVKLESARYGRTRYLVVVSCTRKPTQRELSSQQNLNIYNAQINRKSAIFLQSSTTTPIATIPTTISTSPTIQSMTMQTTMTTETNINLLTTLAASGATTPTTTTTIPSNIINAGSHKSSAYALTNNSLTTNYIKSGTQILINDQRSNVTSRTGPISGSTQDCEFNNDRGIGSSGSGFGSNVSTNERSPKLSARLDSKNMNEIEESCLLGIDCNEKTTVGLVLRILGDTTIRLDGDGGICINACGRTHIFKPVSVQAMWSALQTLHRVSAKARENNFYPGGPSHEWVSYYEDRIQSDRSCLNEWNAMDAIESKRPPSPDAIYAKPTEREETERTIRTALKEIIVQLDLDEVTSKYIRTRLEEYLDMDLTKYKSYIDQEMLTILGQMDAPTKIFDHVYLGSEWNASNLEELQKNGVRHILNVTREIDNFFPGMFDYFNVRVYDDEKTNLLKHWDNTFRYISQAQNDGSKVLVHCKMGVSRSASVVIAYAMKAYDWSFSQAIDYVKKHRNCIKPNKNFLTQLETYQGMLLAMKNKEKLQRSKSDTNLRSTKDARLLPGSEPTPLIQAFNAAAKRTLVETFQSRTLTCAGGGGIGNRPKSWSPDNVESIVLLPKQHSLSMENLPPETKSDCTSKNVRLPCINGQNYSVSQNQVFHLQENNSLNALQQQHHGSSVKLIVKELESLESGQRQRQDFKSGNKETWDPGERPIVEFMRQNSIENRLMTVRNQTSSTICDKTSSTISSTLKQQQQQHQLFNHCNESSFSTDVPVSPTENAFRGAKHFRPLAQLAPASAATETATTTTATEFKTFKSSQRGIAASERGISLTEGFVDIAPNPPASVSPNLSKIGWPPSAAAAASASTKTTITNAFVPKHVWTRRNTFNVNNSSARSTTTTTAGQSTTEFGRLIPGIGKPGIASTATISTAATFLGAAPELIPEFHSGSKHIKNLIKSTTRIDCNSIMLTKSKYYPQIKSRNVT